MVESHGVAVAELRDDSGYDRFFSRSEMHLTGDQSIEPESLDLLLEQAALQHQLIKRPRVGLQAVRLAGHRSSLPDDSKGADLLSVERTRTAQCGSNQRNKKEGRGPLPGTCCSKP